MRLTGHVAGAGIVVMLALSACGSSGGGEKVERNQVQAGECKSGGSWPKAPTVAELDHMMKKGLDSKVSAAEKVQLVQGISGDPDFFNRLMSTLQQSQFVYTINDVTNYCNGTGARPRR